MCGGNYTVYFTHHTENLIRFNLTHRILKLRLNKTFWASIFSVIPIFIYHRFHCIATLQPLKINIHNTKMSIKFVSDRHS